MTVKFMKTETTGNAQRQWLTVVHLYGLVLTNSRM